MNSHVLPVSQEFLDDHTPPVVYSCICCIYMYIILIIKFFMLIAVSDWLGTSLAESSCMNFFRLFIHA